MEDSPLFVRYQELRELAASAEIANLSSRGLHVELITDIGDPLQGAGQPVDLDEEQQVTARSRLANELGLQLLDFSEQSTSPPTAGQILLADNRAGLRKIGMTLTHVSPASTLWSEVMAHTSFGLCPIYDPPGASTDGKGRSIFVPGLREDRSPFSIFDQRRALVTELFVPDDDPANAHWKFLLDPVEVRKRGSYATKEIVNEFLDLIRYPMNSTVSICGIACGAALPDLDAIEVLRSERPDLQIQFDLVDIDHGALELATRQVESRPGFRLKKSESLPEGLRSYAGKAAETDDQKVQIRFVVGNITDEATLLTLANSVGGYDMVEGYGTHEYFNDEVDEDHPFYFMSGYALLGRMRAMCKPGGVAATAHMTIHHNILEILGLVGWVDLKPKSLLTLTDMLERSGGERDQFRLALFDTMSYAFLHLRRSEA